MVRSIGRHIERISPPFLTLKWIQSNCVAHRQPILGLILMMAMIVYTCVYVAVIQTVYDIEDQELHKQATRTHADTSSNCYCFIIFV